jgi:hypothetical protein
VDGALLVVGTTVLDVLLGVHPMAAALYGPANLVVGLTVRLTSSLLDGQPFWSLLPRRLAGVRDLWALGVAALAAALTGAVPGLLAVLVDTGNLTWGATAASVVRGSCSVFVMVAAVLGLLTTLFRARAKRGLSGMLTPQQRRFWGAELAVVVISLASAVVVFSSTQASPIAFVIIVASTWIGFRFSPAVGGSTRSSCHAGPTVHPHGARGPSDPSRTSPRARSSSRCTRW